MFELHSPYKPAGDQPTAIKQLTEAYRNNQDEQVLLGVTGSGKTFTMAHTIQNLQRPTLVIAHNKTLAAQLYQEFRDFFPNNAVSYFVSYYDYYQPEAYIASSDTYIEKEATINDEIDKLRLGTTANLLSRPDSIVVSSVSCIYALGKPEDFASHTLDLIEGGILPRQTLLQRLIDMQYTRTTADLLRGSFRIRGDRVQIWPANENWALSLSMPGNTIESLDKIDPATGERWQEPTAHTADYAPKRLRLFPAKHYIAGTNIEPTLKQIESDMRQRVEELKKMDRVVEAYRLEQRTLHDVDMIREVGFVNGIENYSRYFDGREPGEPPFTLLDYFHYNAKTFGDGKFLTIIDESHITVPQVRGMFAGDRSRKETLIEYGFRLPAAIDNRPLEFQEFEDRLDQVMYVSATPNEWEIQQSNQNVVEQIVRPTGLIDPPVQIRPVDGQIPDLIHEILLRKQKGQRTLVTTLTKKMAEVLAQYLNSRSKIESLMKEHEYQVDWDTVELPKVQYLHSDIDTIDRSYILEQLRRGEYDVLIGVNLLREGLDLPEVTLVAILDADQEGFLRSTSSLIQTMGRAARHVEGQVILYANRETKSMKAAIAEVERRRAIQVAYNTEHNITPTTISKPIREQLIKRTTPSTTPGIFETHEIAPHRKNEKVEEIQGTVVPLNKRESIVLETIEPETLTPSDKKSLIRRLQRVMNEAAKDWNFELAAQIRDTISRLED